MEKALNDYSEKFNENFPMFLFRSADEDEVVKIINECITNDKPYEAVLDEESNY